MILERVRERERQSGGREMRVEKVRRKEEKGRERELGVL